MANGSVLLALREDPLGRGVGGDQLRRIGKELENRGLEVRWARTVKAACAALRTEAGLSAAVVAWDLPSETGEDSDGQGAAVLRQITRRFTALPVFVVMSEDSDHGLDRLPLWVAETAVGYIWPLEDTPSFIAGRVFNAAREYGDSVLPPFFKALRRFDDAHEYSWHTPAHSGGVAFLKSPVGRAFFDYYGERLFRTDLSISVEQLGSLFEQQRPHRGSRAQRRPHLRRRPYVLRAPRRLHRGPHGRPLLRHRRRDRPRGPQLPQVGAARAGHLGCAPGLPRPDPQRIRAGRTAPGARDGARRGRRQDRRPPPDSGSSVARGPVRGDHELDVRRPVLRHRADGARPGSQYAPSALRRGLVRLRALLPAVRGPVRHGRGSGHLRGR